MKRLLLLAWVLAVAGVGCLSQADGFWQSRDSNYNIKITSSGGGYTGPGDVVTGAIAWWGFRCYNTAYAGNVADIWDAATGNTTETLITCSSGGTLNQTIHTLAVTCAIACIVENLYDQSGANSCGGSACTMTHTAGGAVGVPFVLNAVGTANCMDFAGSTTNILKGPTSAFTQAQPLTMSSVVNQNQPSGSGLIYGQVGAQLGLYATSGPVLQIYGGSNANVTVSQNTWYAWQAIVNSSSSISYINGTQTTGLNAGSGTFTSTVGSDMGSDQFGDKYTGYICEVGVWSGAFSTGNQSAMNLNQRAFYGF
jgi:hypothetical protein